MKNDNISKAACLGHVCHFSSNEDCRIEVFVSNFLRPFNAFLSHEHLAIIDRYITTMRPLRPFATSAINYHHHHHHHHHHHKEFTHQPSATDLFGDLRQGFALTVHGWSPNGALEDSIQPGKMMCPSTFQISGLFLLVDKPLIKRS